MIEATSGHLTILPSQSRKNILVNSLVPRTVNIRTMSGSKNELMVYKEVKTSWYRSLVHSMLWTLFTMLAENVLSSARIVAKQKM